MPGQQSRLADARQAPAVMEMRASVLREPGRPVEVETVLLQAPRRGEVLVRVAAAGVCHSDLHLADGLLGPGRWPIVLGHEGAGVVEAVGQDVAGLAPGDHVAFCFVPSCGLCPACRAGRRTLCQVAGERSIAGTLLDGSSRLHTADGAALQHGLMVACFAEYVVVPAAGAIPIPADVPLWEASLLGCAVVTGIGAVSHAAGVRVGQQVCVIGCGGVGMQVIAGARLAGAATIIAADRGEEKLELALRRGATHAVDAASADVPAAVREITGGGVDFAFEVVGSAATIRAAWDSLAPGGTAIVVGLAPAGVEVRVPAIEFLSEKAIKGTYYGSADPVEVLPGLIELVRSRRLELGEVVSDLIGLEDIELAFERLRRGEGGRSIVIVDPGLAGAPEGRLHAA